MLNVCMERRQVRESGLPFSMTQLKTGKSGQEDSEDEFFDCDTEDDDQDTKDVKHDLWNKPEGRKYKLENLTLIDSSEPLYVPVTQDPVLKTEDQLEDDAEVMLKLGPGSELCTQMMSASLLSDMESFKAANPNGKIEDFIRWYSPRDWIEEVDENGETRGHLSQRMLIPDNTWQTVWDTARPVPARRQKRLFDDTKEAEKALHYFETRNIGQICELTLSALYHSALLKIKEEIAQSSFTDGFKENLERVTINMCKLSRESWTSTVGLPTQTTSSAKKWEYLLNEISNLERLIIQAKSLSLKLFASPENLKIPERNLILQLLKGFEAELRNGARNEISARILNMFGEAKAARNEFAVENEINIQLVKQLPEPVQKEYILRLGGKTVNKGVGGPQFLRAILDKNLRICGAFSENTTFF